MTKLEIEIHDDVLAILNKINNIDDHGIELFIPKGSILFDNSLNLRLLEKEAEKSDKTLHFQTDDEFGINLISQLKAEDSEDFNTQEVPAETLSMDEENMPKDKAKRKDKRKAAFVSVKSKIRVRKSRLLKIIIILFLLAGVLGFTGYKALWTIPKANVKVVVNSQPLTKSVQIKIIKDGESNGQNKTLKGYSVSSIVTNKDSIETTGEKIIGEKASGEIKIFNKTTSEKKFKKGHVVVYDEDDNDYEFELKEDVTVPKRTEDAVTLVITPGETTVEVEASDIGEGYNIDDSKDLKIKDQDKDDFTAKTEKEFKGGKSEKIKVVTQEDLDNLSKKLTEQNTEDLEKALQVEAKKNNRIYVKGSLESSVTKDEFDKKIDEEATSVELTQELLTAGLAYSDKELENLLDKLLEELTPEGYTLSSQDKEINVEVLGNSDSTVSSPTEADLQVTIRAFVVTIVEQDKLREELVSKPIQEAEKILSGIKNIQTYELEIDPNIPYFQKMPKNIDNINLTIQRK